MEREKKLSILYQKQGRAIQFRDKTDRDKWLQKEIDELQLVLTSNLSQVKFKTRNLKINTISTSK